MLKASHIEILKALRTVFLSEEPTTGKDYWQSSEHLEAYDAVLGERIAWKWQAVLREIADRKHLETLSNLEIVDWGCGGGRATRSFLDFAREQLPALDLAQTQFVLSDRSETATNWAKAKILEENPSLTSSQISTNLSDITKISSKPPFRLFLLSHVVGELDSKGTAEVLSLLRNFADMVIWVDAGTHALSRKLVTIRDALKATLTPLAPCTHTQSCPMLDNKNSRHWCHFFTKAPAGISSDAEWMEVARTLGIDLRSVPYSFLFCKKQSAPLSWHFRNAHRNVGRPRTYKGYLKMQTCSLEHGISEFRLQKRDAPELFRDISKEKIETPALWELEGQDLSPL